MNRDEEKQQLQVRLTQIKQEEQQEAIAAREVHAKLIEENVDVLLKFVKPCKHQAKSYSSNFQDGCLCCQLKDTKEHGCWDRELYLTLILNKESLEPERRY